MRRKQELIWLRGFMQCTMLTSREWQISAFKWCTFCSAFTHLQQDWPLIGDPGEETVSLPTQGCYFSIFFLLNLCLQLHFCHISLSWCDDQSLEAHYCKMPNHLKWSFISLWWEEKSDQRTLLGLSRHEMTVTHGCMEPLWWAPLHACFFSWNTAKPNNKKTEIKTSLSLCLSISLCLVSVSRKSSRTE